MPDDAFSLLHKGVQRAIWDMGWTEFRPIQSDTIHAFHETDHHLVLCAHTASGKTEAAFLPVISAIAEDPQPSVQALYIGPLKALINDQFRRLESLCQHLDLSVWRWHGDVSATEKRRLRENPSGILLITPESLESNFINHGVHIPHIYRHTQWVVIDELHAFLDEVRGIHLRSLLCRLMNATGKIPRILALSATLGDPQAARIFINPENPDTVKVIEDSGEGREIKFKILAHLEMPSLEGGHRNRACLGVQATVELAQGLAREDLVEQGSIEHRLPSGGETPVDSGLTDSLDEIAEDLIHNLSQGKNLVFVNAKSTLEILADRVRQTVRRERWSRDPFLVHHGSLSRDLREEAEADLKSEQPATAICSSTLEMGIDIGDARAIGQVGVPWSVASMVQRLGRSGRRDGVPSIMRVHVTEDAPHGDSTLSDLLFPDLLRAVAMTRLMIAGWLEPPEIHRMHLSTLVHQILSCLRQTGGMHARDLHTTLVEHGAFREIDSAQYLSLLKGLGQRHLIEQMPTGALILAPDGERITGHWDFYAAFQSGEEYVVKHGSDNIGMLPALGVPPPGEHVILAGRRWQVSEIFEESKTVMVVPARGAKPPVYSSMSGEIHSRIAEEMRAVLFDDDCPLCLDPNGLTLLGAARRMARCVGLDHSSVIIRPTGVQWFPWVGTRVARTLHLFATDAGINTDQDRISITYKDLQIDEFRGHMELVSEYEGNGLELAELLRVKTFEKYDEYVEPSLLTFANARDRLDVEGAKRATARGLKEEGDCG